MTKEFYSKVSNDLKTLEGRKLNNNPITKRQLNEFKRECVSMLEMFNRGTNYDMSTQKKQFRIKLTSILNT